MSSNYIQYLGAKRCCDLRVQGPQGPQGAQGVASVGSMGYQGATGTQGYQGATGRGCVGPTGAQGPAGTTGPSGGPQGVTGAQGATGTTGSQGATGAQGVTGAQGATGTIGVTGSQGATGAQGLIGAVGTTGSQGYQGVTGSQGYQGVTGSQGVIGTTGAQGYQGVTGASQWTSMNGPGITGGGYTGIGITGQDVLIYGNLLVTGGIDPTYLALTPQTSGPQGFINPLWVDSINDNALRSENIYMDKPSVNNAYISLKPDNNATQIILSDGVATKNELLYSNSTLTDAGGVIGQMTAGGVTVNNNYNINPTLKYIQDPFHVELYDNYNFTPAHDILITTGLSNLNIPSTSGGTAKPTIGLSDGTAGATGYFDLGTPNVQIMTNFGYSFLSSTELLFNPIQGSLTNPYAYLNKQQLALVSNTGSTLIGNNPASVTTIDGTGTNSASLQPTALTFTTPSLTTTTYSPSGFSNSDNSIQCNSNNGFIMNYGSAVNKTTLDLTKLEMYNTGTNHNDTILLQNSGSANPVINLQTTNTSASPNQTAFGASVGGIGMTYTDLTSFQTKSLQLNNPIGSAGILQYSNTLDGQPFIIASSNTSLSLDTAQDLILNGTNIISGSAGSSSGQNLRILLNGNYYKIALLND